MKIVRLEQDKIKVILSQNDLLDMDIDLQDITPDSPELSEFLKDVMETVREETGFTMDNGQVIVEASPFANGIVLMLTKIKKNPDKSRIKGIKAVKKNERAVFEFLGFDDLIGMLINADYENMLSMTLYQYMNAFYITIPKNNIPPVIYEYSFKSNKSSIAESFLSEYGKILAEGMQLVKMIVGLKKIN